MSGPDAFSRQQVLFSATHAELMSAGNVQYMKALARVADTERKLGELQQELLATKYVPRLYRDGQVSHDTQ